MELKNFDKLVQAITSNILEKIDIEPIYPVLEKSCLVLVPNIGFGMNDYRSYVNENYPGFKLYVGGNETLTNTPHVNNSNSKFVMFDFTSNDFVQVLEEVEHIIIVGLKISQMKSLIDVDDADDINHVILGSLMANKPVTVILNTNSPILDKISETIKGITELGIEVVNLQEPKQDNKEVVTTELITERYIEDISKNGSKVLYLQKRQLITPLAKDKLRELKINIEYHKEEN